MPPLLFGKAAVDVRAGYSDIKYVGCRALFVKSLFSVASERAMPEFVC